MPSPIGHTLAGYIAYRVTGKPVDGYTWVSLALYVFSANVADLDFIPGFVIGDPNRFHHGISHSLGFAALFAVACSLGLVVFKRDTYGKHFAVFFLLYSSHIGLDYLSIDTSMPYGVPMFWPLSHAYHIAPFAFLPDIRRASSVTAFFPSLFSLHNFWAVTVECLILIPFITSKLILTSIKIHIKTNIVIKLF